MNFLFVSLIIVLVDQVSKIFVKGSSFFGINGFPLYTSFPILGDFIRFTYVENAGLAFGVEVGSGKIFFTIFSLIISFVLLFFIYKMRNEKSVVRLSVSLILGGAIGNLIDRIFYGLLYDEGGIFFGKVVDFIDVDFFDINFLNYKMARWPIFNVADISVSIGIILFLFFYREKKKQVEVQIQD